ncbi:hypothetical protein SISSUDRAFT_1061682 [Sistotremastrum suecicum HHB10207 ss-3]|uniref:MYND-type domain-containing protein n=1 Tax=Sistotremastrum suecicum HHB10207 ss-3 TaxID=1314776 RepID=A0A166DP86_9AGAM|nr:hypothetical protein SISSUDRAFT_1061682 [Sistotremastrum suecicum HHB10207 ss-3]
MPPRSSKPRPKPKFVRLHPDDPADLLDPVFLEDPAEFVPYGNDFGETVCWGLKPYDKYGYEVSNQIFEAMRKMQAQMPYLEWHLPPPENQFVNALIKKKEADLASLHIDHLRRRDFVLKIYMPDIPKTLRSLDDIKRHRRRVALGEELIYRRFKVSGGINLEAFQDKSELCLFNRDRNAHAYLFTDLSDGAGFGPRDASTIDISHKDGVGYEFLHADEYVLAHLVQSECEVFEYLYDYGDNWVHRVQVDAILSVEDSDGALWYLKDEKEAIEMMQWADNYQGKAVNGKYDLFHFSLAIEETQADVSEALSSAASVRSGGKTFIQQMTPSFDPMSMFGGFPSRKPLKKGESIARTFDERTVHPSLPSYMQETVSDRRDKAKIALCATCGTTHELKACSRCRKMWYCGGEHQKQHWKTHKRDCVAAEAS